jgi:serine/threonine-protein kinase
MDHDLIAEALPGYEIGQELGRGGWGVVLAARHRQLERAVAIKQLPSVFSADENVRQRFLAEARVLASLTHPHIIPVYDYVEHKGVCLLVMEQLTGGTLWTRFTERGLTPESACAALLATCAGLHYAHQHDVLHRDVKPENLMFSADGVPKVTDFGIAKVLTGGETMATRAGEVLGTPAYMAPEQSQGETIGAPADVYAAGIMLYELLSGRLPFSEEGGALSIVYRHVNEQPAPITEVAPQLPRALADVVMTAIARSIDDRYATAEDFAVALGEAATATWGPGWLDRAELSVVVGDPILASTVRPTSQPTSEQGSQAPPATPPAAQTIIDAGPATARARRR